MSKTHRKPVAAKPADETPDTKPESDAGPPSTAEAAADPATSPATPPADAAVPPVADPLPDDMPEPDATNNAGADDPNVPEAPVTLDVILSDLAKPVGDETTGVTQRSPTPRLTADQGQTQLRLHRALTARGVKIRRQQDVYAWLLDQIAAAIGQGA